MKQIHNDPCAPLRVGSSGALDRLFELATLLSEAMQHSLGERGLTTARAAMLWLLYHQGPVTQRRLADVLRVTPRNVTGLVDALEAAGYAARRPHPTDRRATLVTLTDHGHAAVAHMHTGYQELTATLFGDLPAADLSVFLTTLDHVLTRLRATDLAGIDHAAGGHEPAR